MPTNSIRGLLLLISMLVAFTAAQSPAAAATSGVAVTAAAKAKPKKPAKRCARHARKRSRPAKRCKPPKRRKVTTPHPVAPVATLPLAPAQAPMAPLAPAAPEAAPAPAAPAEDLSTGTPIDEGEPLEEGYGGAPYAAGHCTRYAWSRRQDLPGNLGNAGTWDERAAAAGFPVDSRPDVGDIAVWEPWTYGTQGYGHVAYVEAVNADGTIRVAEWNWVGLGKLSVRTIKPTGLRFIGRKGQPTAAPSTPVFDDVQVHARPTLDATAGDVVRWVITARLVSAAGGRIPCGLANAGSVDDKAIRWADTGSGVWFRNPARVAAVSCAGDLDVGEHGRWDIAVRPPADTPSGTYAISTVGFVHEGVAWSTVRLPLAVRVTARPSAQLMAPLQEVPIAVAPGGKTYVDVAVANRSSRTWTRGTDNLHLVDEAQRDMQYPYCSPADPRWVNGNSLLLEEESVAPGETGHYRMPICRSGAYVGSALVRLSVVQEGVAHRERFDIRLRFS